MPKQAEPIPSTAAFDKAMETVKSLVSDFDANRRYFLSPEFSESQARKDFIDKFFIALGWDVNHDYQKNPHAQEVKVERGVNTTNSLRRADYTFYLEPDFSTVRFFVEAKKPFGDIASPDNCFQAIRYGWSAQTPITVLTNFVQFVILDSRYKSDIQSATSHIIEKFNYLQYKNPDVFGRIYYPFSREAVAGGWLEKYSNSLPKPRDKAAQLGFFKGGYQSVDESFLLELDEYRERLARNFKKHNLELDGPTLTEITQRVIDRLVFIRFLEDKMIQPEHLLSEFGSRNTPWQDFISASRKLDAFCNGIVFKKHSIIDSPSFKVGQQDFAGICQKLGHINSPYDFNAIPIHILGSIYERFLGKVITTTAKRATVEEKPEVRKAGGVYYTPEYIVRYIVENTVGKLIEGKTPAQIAEMHFADIACGSGSFLLGVFDLLLRYHSQWYNARPAQAKKSGCELRDDGAWHLPLHLRRAILLNNIYGVDIDRQAVEVAQLSLYLKLLEEETTATAHDYQPEFHQTLLPRLDRNIVCGNSLIGSDIISGQMFETEEEKKLNPMDFQDRFPEIMRNGGFHAIVGNPPYVRQETLGQLFKVYAKKKFRVFSSTADLYTYFIERAHSLLRPSGLFGYIVSNKFMRANYGLPLRDFLRNRTTLIQFIDFGELPVFRDAATFPAIVITQNSLCRSQAFLHAAIKRLDFDSLTREIKKIGQTLDDSALEGQSWTLANPSSLTIIRKIRSLGIPLCSYTSVRINYGIKTGFDRAFIVNPETRKELISADRASAEVLKKYAIGDDVRNYSISDKGRWLIFFPRGWTNANKPPRVDPWRWLKGKYPAIADHLAPFAEDAAKRCDQGDYWWELRACSYYDAFEKPKLVWPEIAKEPRFAFDANSWFFNKTCFILPVDDLYLLAILNSRVSWLFLKNTCSVLGDADKRGRLLQQKIYLDQLPIRQIDFSNSQEKARHQKIVSLVQEMLEAKRHFLKSRSDADKDYYGNKCLSLDRQINALIYELYDLSCNEIASIESNNGFD